MPRSSWIICCVRWEEDHGHSVASDGVRAVYDPRSCSSGWLPRRWIANLIKLETAYPALKSSHVGAGALVAIDPATGGILAMVGSRDYRMSQFNRPCRRSVSQDRLFAAGRISPPWRRVVNRNGGQPGAGGYPIVDEPVTFECPRRLGRRRIMTTNSRDGVRCERRWNNHFNIPAVKIAQRSGRNAFSPGREAWYPESAGR